MKWDQNELLSPLAGRSGEGSAAGLPCPAAQTLAGWWHRGRAGPWQAAVSPPLASLLPSSLSLLLNKRSAAWRGQKSSGWGLMPTSSPTCLTWGKSTLGPQRELSLTPTFSSQVSVQADVKRRLRHSLFQGFLLTSSRVITTSSRL